MELMYLFVLILCYAGIFIGYFTGKIAKEELKPGKRYFIIFQRSIFALISIIIISTMFINKNDLIGAILLIAFIYLESSNHPSKDIQVYSLLSIILYLSYINKNILFLESSLIFLYGFPTGSLITEKRGKLFDIIKRYSIFLIIGLILPFTLVYS